MSDSQSEISTNSENTVVDCRQLRDREPQSTNGSNRNNNTAAYRRLRARPVVRQPYFTPRFTTQGRRLPRSNNRTDRPREGQNQSANQSLDQAILQPLRLTGTPGPQTDFSNIPPLQLPREEAPNNHSESDTQLGEMEGQAAIDEMRSEMATLTSIIERMSAKLSHMEKKISNQTDRRESVTSEDNKGYCSQNSLKEETKDNINHRMIQTMKFVKPPEFNGETSEAVMWLLNYNEVADTNLWNDDIKIRQVSQSLTQGAKSWYRKDRKSVV